MASSIKALHIT